MVRQKIVYTDSGGKKKHPIGGVWSWRVVVVTWSWPGVGEAGGCVGGGATDDQR